MNTHQSTNSYSVFVNEEEGRQIEDAVRAAIKTVTEVFSVINRNKLNEYQMRVAERDKENGTLRIRLETAEKELVSLRRFKQLVVQCGSTEPLTDGIATCGLDSGDLSEENNKQSLCVKSKFNNDERQSTSPCERKIVLADSHYRNSETQSSDIPFSEDLNQEGPSWRLTSTLRSENQIAPESSTKMPVTPPNNLRMKEEPLDLETVYIKWEMCEESDRREEAGLVYGSVKDCEPHLRSTTFGPLSCPRGGTHPAFGTQDVSFSQSLPPAERVMNLASCYRKRMSNRERQQRYRDRIRADPEKQRAYRERDRCRYQKRRKLICDLPEQTQKLKREAWREAARRYRARKQSCLQRTPFTYHQSTEMEINSTGNLTNYH